MESTLQKPARAAAKTTPTAKAIVYWMVTALFCLQMSFTAYAQLRLPEVAEAFNHLGFPAYFRVELSWAKLLGVVLFACAGAGAAQRMGLRRLRHRPRLGAHRAPLGGRWLAGVGLGGGHRRALGLLVLLLAPPAGHAGERLTAHEAEDDKVLAPVFAWTGGARHIGTSFRTAIEPEEASTCGGRRLR
jgi:hypothetical protein